MRTVIAMMPWASTVRPSLGVGTLVAAARTAGFECSATYPSLHLAAAIGPAAYELFADTSRLFPLAEHIFAVDLFGREALDSDGYLQRALGGSADAEAIRAALVRMRDGAVPAFLDETTQALIETGADIVGFSCTFNQVLPSLAVAKRLKAVRPDLTVILGGACVHDRMGEAYARAFMDTVDHVFTGEADVSFVDFLRRAEAGGSVSIPGVTDRGVLPAEAAPVTDLGALPVPDFGDYFRERAGLAEAAAFVNLPFEASRGCWWGEKHHCTFCGLNAAGMSYRSKPAARVVAELVELSAAYRTTSFMAADNILDFRAYSGFLGTIADAGLDLDLFFEIKANVRRSDVELLAKAGVRWVQPGIESFSDHVLSLIDKGVTTLQNVQLLKWLAEFGVTPSYNILVGFPGEADADYAEMLDVIPAIRHLCPPSGGATPVQVHRFSPFYRRPQIFGETTWKAESYYRHLIPPAVLAPEAYAYFFERPLPEDSPLQRWLPRLNAALQQWRDEPMAFHARLGPGFIAVRRHEQLTPAESLAMVLCDRHVAVDWLTGRMRALLPEISPGEVLESLIHRGLALRIRNRIVSLVPFDRPHSEADLSEWLRRWFGSGSAVISEPAAVLVQLSQ
jgi:ribosomal peptide maturation radical SAM protein 1